MMDFRPKKAMIFLLSLCCLFSAGCAKHEKITLDPTVVNSTLGEMDKSMVRLDGMIQALKPKINAPAFSAINASLAIVRFSLADLTRDPLNRTKASALLLSLDNLYQKFLEAQTEKNKEDLFAVEDVVDEMESGQLEPTYKIKPKKQK